MSAGIGTEADMECEGWAGVRITQRLCFERHSDVEFAFLAAHAEGEEEEHQQLEDDVDHRRHLQLDLLILTRMSMAELHGKS